MVYTPTPYALTITAYFDRYVYLGGRHRVQLPQHLSLYKAVQKTVRNDPRIVPVKPYPRQSDVIFKIEKREILTYAEYAAVSRLNYDEEITLLYGFYFLLLAAIRVFFIKEMIVIGPTPPGTGVMYSHLGATSS